MSQAGRTENKNYNTTRRWASYLAPLLIILSTAMVIINSFDYYSLRKAAYNELRSEFQQDSDNAVVVIEQLIRRVEKSAEALAAGISDDSLPREQYQQALAAMLEKEDMFYGGTIAFAPYAFDPRQRLHAPYFFKKAGKMEFMYIEDGYDYTLEENEWYVQAMASGSMWSKPYFDEAAGDILMTTYSAVVYRPDINGGRQPIAVVTIDLGIEAIGNTVQSLNFGGEGFAELVTEQGLYLHSPNKNKVLRQLSLFDNEQWLKNENFSALQLLLAANEAGIQEIESRNSEIPNWVSVTPVASTNWRMIVNYSGEEIAPRGVEIRHRIMLIILWGAIGLCAALLFKQVIKPKQAIISWPTSILVSLVLAIAIGKIWQTTMEYTSDMEDKGFSITNKGSAQKVETYFRNQSKEHLTAEPVFIPTGIYIESMKFTSPNDILIIGSVWQKFDLETQQDVERGVIFPGAANVAMGEAFTSRTEDSELVRWQFQASFRFSMEYGRYPMVKDAVQIGMSPRDIAGNVLLMPDVESYPYLAPSSLPAVSQDVFLSGWSIESSYFELRKRQQNTTFGKEKTIATESLPELFFNIDIEKIFIHAFISYLTPLIIACLMAFITLMIATRDKERLEFMRTGIGFDIAISTSIFFVVVLSHIGLRQRIVSEEVFYLEYFYLLMYTNLIWVCCHSIMIGLNQPLLEKFTFGVAAKKAFFPVNMLVMFVFTWLTFYS